MVFINVRMRIEVILYVGRRAYGLDNRVTFR